MSSEPPDPYPIRTLRGPFRASIIPPGSKSLTNRAMLLAALAPGTSTIHRPLRAGDTEVMVRALTALLGSERVRLKTVDDNWSAIEIEGAAGRFDLPNDLGVHLENAGTATRFLAAACAFAKRPVTIDGNARMRERPIGELVDALRTLGATIEYAGRDGFVPLRVHPSRLRGGRIAIGETRSSQFISALLQIGPLCENGLTIEFTGRTRSPSYIAMTLGLMERFGATFTVEGALERVAVSPGGYRATEYAVEPDASSATYFHGAAAVSPGSVATIERLGHPSLQGDAGFAEILRQMGAGLTFGADFQTVIGPTPERDEPFTFGPPALRGIDIDMNHMPDAAMTLAVVALFASGETVIRGIGNLKYKETDRLAALRTELSKFGARVEIEDDELLAIEPPAFDQLISNKRAITIDTYDDHRMAMAFAIAGLRVPNVAIRDPLCVRKTYPAFWEDWARLGSEDDARS